MAGPIDYSIPYGNGYDNVNDAASAADYEWTHFSDNKDRERATIIYRNKRDGKIYRTPPIGGGATDVHLQDVFDQLANDQIPLAVLHNHPMPGEGYPKDINNFLSDADSRIGRGYGLDEKKNETPIMTGRGPTGPMKLFLIRPDGTLGEATGEYKARSYYDKRDRMTVHHDFQSTEGALGQVPIDEIVRGANRRSRAAGLDPSRAPVVTLDPNAQLADMPWNDYRKWLATNYLRDGT